MDAFSVEDNSTQETNTATRLITITLIDRKKIVPLNPILHQGSTSTTFKAIAQQVVIQNDQRRITSIGLKVSMKGEVDSPKDRVNCDIVMDGGDDTPTGTTLATFNISLSDLTSNPTVIFIDDVDVKVRFLEGENKIWIRMFQRSSNATVQGHAAGDPNHDEDNTIRWSHNGSFNVAQNATYPRSATAVEGDYDKKDTLTWNVSAVGPSYVFSIFSDIKRLQSRTNPTAVKKLRLKEQVIDSSFLSDPKTIGQFLSVNLAEKSKVKRTIPDFRVSVPNNFLFRPYQLVDFSDGLSGITQTLQVQRVRYIVSALAGDPQIGALDCNLQLGGAFNSLTESCSCDT
jgi:hypothetical protein